jgi:hypothetical protein
VLEKEGGQEEEGDGERVGKNVTSNVDSEPGMGKGSMLPVRLSLPHFVTTHSYI